MPISTTRPEYDNISQDWRKVRDCIEGETALRRDIAYYLPIPPGMDAGGVQVLDTGKRIPGDRYSFYASFAEFPEIVSPTLNGILGLVHEKDPEIKLPGEKEWTKMSNMAAAQKILTPKLPPGVTGDMEEVIP